MKSPVLHFPYDFRTKGEDVWRFGYSAFDNGCIYIWKNGVKRKVRVIDIREEDGAICQDITKDPVEITGGAKALYNNWYSALVDDTSVFNSGIARNEIISLYERLDKSSE